MPAQQASAALQFQSTTELHLLTKQGNVYAIMTNLNQQSNPFPCTIIFRHRRENLRKCSLRGLESHKDFTFYTYPREKLPPLNHYALLTLDAPPLSRSDDHLGLLILDGTWRYAATMHKQIAADVELTARSIPGVFRTAYPRRQEDCSDPDYGLASIEAIYIAYCILGRNVQGLLNNYYWKNQFIEKNRNYLDFYQQQTLY